MTWVEALALNGWNIDSSCASCGGRQTYKNVTKPTMKLVVQINSQTFAVYKENYCIKAEPLIELPKYITTL